MSQTCLAQLGKIEWKLLEEYGFNPEIIFQEVGFDPKQMKSPDARINHEVAENLWRASSELISDPCFGMHAAKYWHPSHLGALGYAWLTSSSLRTAFNRLERYIHTVSEFVDLYLEESDDGFVVTVSPKSYMEDIPARIDLCFSILVEMCRINTGESFNPKLVTFTHEEYPDSGVYYSCFRSPIQFSADQNTMIIPSEIIDIKLEGAIPEYAHLNDHLLTIALAKLNRENVEHRVKAAIIESLPCGDVSQEKIAQILHMSVRSLQRKLKIINTSFRSLLAETRRELAENYIDHTSMSLSEVTYLLGFSESSSFTRAYKRWHGISPQQVRNNLAVS